jgi:hypothetical protein
MRRLLRTALAATMLLHAACSDDSPATPGGTPDANPGGSIALIDWVGSMTADSSDDAVPDTVEDKLGILIDSDDPEAFNAMFTGAE